MTAAVLKKTYKLQHEYKFSILKYTKNVMFLTTGILRAGWGNF